MPYFLMPYFLVWTCAELVRAQLERAYFLDLLDDGEDAPEVCIIGLVNLKRRAGPKLKPTTAGDLTRLI